VSTAAPTDSIPDLLFLFISAREPIRSGKKGTLPHTWVHHAHGLLIHTKQNWADKNDNMVYLKKWQKMSMICILQHGPPNWIQMANSATSEFIQTCWFQMKHEHLQCCDEQRLNYTIIRCSLLTPTKRLKVCGIDLDPLCAFDEWWDVFEQLK